jgi:hypothetical protein
MGFDTGGFAVSSICINDPLGAVRSVVALSSLLESWGYSVSLNNNINDLLACRASKREGNITPFFDPEVCGLNSERFFWLKISTPEIPVAGIQAFRCDVVDTSLLDWAPSYHIGLYMRRKELCVPTFSAPAASSIAHRIKGKLVYHGELWLDNHTRHRKVLDTFTRLGMLLSYIRWNPDAVWALTNQQMASHGHPHRMGYGHVESGFLKWDWAPEGNALTEYLLVSDRQALEHIVEEITMGQEADPKSKPQVAADRGQILPFRLFEYRQEQFL